MWCLDSASGIEILTKCMTMLFSKVIKVIHKRGGDVIKFAGDSLIVAFYATDEEMLNEEDKGLKMSTFRALQCAQELNDKLSHVKILSNGNVEPIDKKEFNNKLVLIN